MRLASLVPLVSSRMYLRRRVMWGRGAQDRLIISLCQWLHAYQAHTQFTALCEDQIFIAPVQLDSDLIGRKKAEQHRS